MECLYAIENSVAVGGGIPKEFQILPLGLVHSQKGDFLVDSESYSCIRQEFKERKLQIPVDYEHQTLHDVQAPAAGWIRDIILKSDGIYAAVEWTERAAEYLKNREYKYCSPVIMARNSDHKAVKLHSVALTNKPAIDAMTPIVNKDKPSTTPADEETLTESTAPEEDVGMVLEKLTALLQLPASATMEDICQAVSALIKGSGELKLKVDAMEFEAHKLSAEKVVGLALKEGKLLPYQKDWAFRNAMADMNEFSLWLKDAPQIVPMSEIFPSEAPQPRHKSSRSDELLGLTHEDIQKYT